MPQCESPHEHPNTAATILLGTLFEIQSRFSQPVSFMVLDAKEQEILR
jgi:hypothetical protein